MASPHKYKLEASAFAGSYGGSRGRNRGGASEGKPAKEAGGTYAQSCDPELVPDLIRAIETAYSDWSRFCDIGKHTCYPFQKEVPS
jgi:hypothetical protein